MFRTEDVIRLTMLIMAEGEMVTKEITQIVRSLTEIVVIRTDMKWITIEKLKHELLVQGI